MGKIPSFVIIIIGVVIIVGIAGFFYLMPINKAKADIASLEDELQQLESQAAGLDAAQADLDKAKAEAAAAEALLAQKMAERSIPMSFIYPFEATYAVLWPEYQENLPELIRAFVDQSGCSLLSATALPAPPLRPPAYPAGGFLQIPEGQSISLMIEGRLADLERFYRSLRNFPRIVTVDRLSLTRQDTGERLAATVGLNVYLLVEVPEAAPAVAMAAAGMGMGGAMAPGMGGPGMPPGMGGPPGGPMGPGGAGPGESTEEELEAELEE